MISLVNYLKQEGASGSIKLINGPNGKWISYTVEGVKNSIPVGGSTSSQNAMLTDMNILIADNGQPIATANIYETVDEVEL